MGRFGAFIGAVVGAFIGFLLSLWQQRAAEAAVRVRPKLAEVGFVDAWFSGHGTDWLFYHEPAIGFGIGIALPAIVLLLYGWAH